MSWGQANNICWSDIVVTQEERGFMNSIIIDLEAREIRVMLKIMKPKCDKMVIKHEKWTPTLMPQLHFFWWGPQLPKNGIYQILPWLPDSLLWKPIFRRTNWQADWANPVTSTPVMGGKKHTARTKNTLMTQMDDTSENANFSKVLLRRQYLIFMVAKHASMLGTILRLFTQPLFF